MTTLRRRDISIPVSRSETVRAGTAAVGPVHDVVCAWRKWARPQAILYWFTACSQN